MVAEQCFVCSKTIKGTSGSDRRSVLFGRPKPPEAVDMKRILGVECCPSATWCHKKKQPGQAETCYDQLARVVGTLRSEEERRDARKKSMRSAQSSEGGPSNAPAPAPAPAHSARPSAAAKAAALRAEAEEQLGVTLGDMRLRGASVLLSNGDSMRGLQAHATRDAALAGCLAQSSELAIEDCAEIVACVSELVSRVVAEQPAERKQPAEPKQPAVEPPAAGKSKFTRLDRLAHDDLLSSACAA
jgi:hypothetical protein